MEKTDKPELNYPKILSVLPVRDTAIFPMIIVPLMIKDDDNINLIDDALKGDKLIIVAMVKNRKNDNKDLIKTHKIATICKIIKFTPEKEGSVLAVQGLSRANIDKIISEYPYKQAKITELKNIEHSGKEIDSQMTDIWILFKQIVNLSPHLADELVKISLHIDQPGPLADMITSTLKLDYKKNQEMLETLDVKERLEKLKVFLDEEIQFKSMGKEIQEEVEMGLDQSKREYYLKEQLKTIKEKLGMDQSEVSEIEELQEKCEEKDLPKDAKKVVNKELKRLSKMQPVSPEYTVSRTYLDWFLDLPWLESTDDMLDIKQAEKVLHKYHYNLEKIKQRILEYLSVRKLNPGHKGPILCFTGPPGTGKTSLGRSIAEALGRKFIRISLGGVRDEAEIRGHRRTYVGALPGRIIQGLKKTSSNNPVFMLDEIDKLGTDFRGDPASALLEVLDPEQNFSFADHYLELEFDLSKVMFITTANQLDPIPSPLLDRMEVLELAGYTEDEKINIATRFLIKRQTIEHGLGIKKVLFRKAAIKKIIRGYTREAGLRNLEREIGSVCRRLARRVAEGANDKFIITDKNIHEFLGNPKFTSDLKTRTSIPGVAIGMAWTAAGGDILFVEATMMPGQKSLVLTGQLGEIMKESAQTALSYIRSNAEQLNICDDFYQNHDLHIHVPAGAIPKDGPSAGITILTALTSLLTSRSIKPQLSMTGEVTLRGAVLPVGGVKEKVLAANRYGIKHVILPHDNKRDLDDIPDKIKKQLKFYFVKQMDEVLKIAFNPIKKKSCKKK